VRHGSVSDVRFPHADHGQTGEALGNRKKAAAQAHTVPFPVFPSFYFKKEKARVRNATIRRPRGAISTRAN